MFPLRCPMHHAGCTTNISDLHARRVLGRKEYRKFVDFYDRSVLGEGIHCLKCGSFVNLPRDGDPMVQCPYCAYRWCVRCKCPWHPNIKCSERADVEVEEWREAHGAQRCPGCFKIIEKDDPESCNHMTHKNTDVMPCTRERTDFCIVCVEINSPRRQLDIAAVWEHPTHSLISTQVIVAGWRSRPTILMPSSTSWKQCRNQNSITYLTHWLISHQARYTSLPGRRLPGL